MGQQIEALASVENVAKREAAEQAVWQLLHWIGEDPKRQGLKDTPKRVAKALQEMTAGYSMDPAKVLSTVFDTDNDEMVVVRDVKFSSLCEHHMLPFAGTATIGYVPGDVMPEGLPELTANPDKDLQAYQRQVAARAKILQEKGVKHRIVGLSKIPRLVQVFARRLQVQEQLTQQVAEAMEKHLKPKGVGVLVRARHTCCAARGARSETEMVTSCLRGVFRAQPDTRAEFLALAREG